MQGIKYFDFEFKQQIERNILTALLMSDRAYDVLNKIWNGEKQTVDVLQVLFDNNFYAEAFTELWNMYKKGEKIDPVTLKDKISNEYDEVTLSDIMNIMRDSNSQSADVRTVMFNGYALLGMYWEGEEIG